MTPLSKTIILVLFTALFFTCALLSCGHDDPKEKNKNLYPVGNRCVEITTIDYDSCEYLVTRYELTASITHKGNCKYCEMRKK